VALHYKDAPNGVVFEILNEPNGAMNESWNDVLAENLAIIRASNPTRRVVIGPRMWNSMGELDNLRLPAADRNIVVTFHYYTPMEFTHQGAWLARRCAWSGRMPWHERQRRKASAGRTGSSIRTSSCGT